MNICAIWARRAIALQIIVLLIVNLAVPIELDYDGAG
jgi:hypothetical protein